MKFLVDAHLPRRLVYQVRVAGHDAIHTSGLPLGNRTPDNLINVLTIQEERILVTKDADFVNSFWLHHKPFKLLLVSTGNITNQELLVLFQHHLQWLSEAFERHDFIELDQDRLTIHA